MKKLIVIIAAAATLASCAQQRTIEQTLALTVEKGQYLFGHQDDLMYGHDWNGNTDVDHNFTRSDVFSTTGSYPAVLGLDMGGIELGNACNLDGNDFGLMKEAARKHWQRGGIVTLSWHLRNPLTGGDAWDVSSDKVVESILPGGEKHEMFLGWLDNLAAFISDTGVPVIFRPWHEHSGSWFWWGAGLCTPEQYNELWRMTHDYLTDTKGLADIVWAISPNIVDSEFESWEERYPGDAYVDIIGFDCYAHRPRVSEDPEVVSDWQTANEEFITEMHYGLITLERMAKEHHKILAVTETGMEGMAYENWWTEVLQPAIEGFPIAYVLVWRNANEPEKRDHHFYTPFPDGPGEADFKKFADSEQTIFIK